MSLPLIDFRGKITPETDAILDATQRSTGRDKSEIVRDWLHQMALQKINAAIEIQKALKREGIMVAEQGGRGNSQFGELPT